MSLVDQIKKLNNEFETDDKFNELKNALDIYHEMVKDGVLIPRKNSLMSIYTPFVSEKDVKFSNLV